MLDLVQSSLDSDITRETFDELLQDMIEVNPVKLRTTGERTTKRFRHDNKQDHNRFSHFSITA